ncbi:MAG: sigma factor-like helix-turn-helix DNA-binding protein [Acidimicrobiales bacterium]
MESLAGLILGPDLDDLPPPPEPPIMEGPPAAGLLVVRFPDFYREGRDRIARALTLTLGDADLAVEAVDEAMARAYQRWARVSTLENPGGWVYRVALNWSCSVLRRRRRAPAPRPDRDLTDIGPIREPAVLAALAALDVRQRAVVVCRHLLGWSEAETAIALSTPVGTVKSRLHRANQTLARRLGHLRDEPGPRAGTEPRPGAATEPGADVWADRTTLRSHHKATIDAPRADQLRNENQP